MKKILSSEKIRRRVPPGQFLVDKWPVLSYGPTPRFDPARWDFHLFGLVEEPVRLTHQEFRALPQTQLITDFHCVTSWSRLDNFWELRGYHVRGDPWKEERYSDQEEDE